MFPTLLTATALLVADNPERAEATRPALLVGFDDLQKRLDEPNLRLVDVRPRADYERSHIPGAVWADLKSAESLAARKGGLEDREAWEAWIKPLGIGQDSSVLVYGDNRQLDAARVWWLLRYLGVQNVGLINGNFSLWSIENDHYRPNPAKSSRSPSPYDFGRIGLRLGTRFPRS